jgi:4-hydroxy-3-methylbut-2-en-1-yl diphosphate reductase
LNLITSDLAMRSSEALSPPLTILLAAPRGFCAGVVRAIDAVENALDAYGAPIYVRRAIVHNHSVVRALEAKGAHFIEELDEAPEGSTVVLSAHGVSRTVVSEGRRMGLSMIDAVCPLVAKVHREVQRYSAEGRDVVLIGHAGHPEILGTLGQIPQGAASLVSSVADIDALPIAADQPLAYAVQTTFSVEEAEALVAALGARFSDLVGPSSSDICYATTNRQRAVRTIAPRSDAMIVVGDDMSSNANRLVEVARAMECPAQLVSGPEAIDWDRLDGVEVLGLTSAASTPERNVEAVLSAFHSRFRVELEEVGAGDERAAFRPVLV